jgi:hypothetical protein
VVEREGCHDEIDGIVLQGKTSDVTLPESYAASQSLPRKITVSRLDHALRDIDSHQLKMAESTPNQSQ